MSALCLLLVLLKIALGGAASRGPGLDFALLVIAMTLLIRFFILMPLVQSEGSRLPAARRHLIFIAGSTATSLAFMGLNILAFPLLPPYPLAFLLVCEAGIVSTAMVSMSGSPLAFLLYLIPMIGSDAALAWHYRGLGLPPVFALMILFFMGTLVAVSLGVHRTTRDNFLMRIKLEEMALRDTLTGLRNRRYLQEFLEAELERIMRSWHPSSKARGTPPRRLAILMVDLDHFKSVNDTCGHAMGDEVLVQTARILGEAVRSTDVVVRWGGEEFLVLVQDPPQGMHPPVAERIREMVGQHSFQLSSGETLRLTCTVGYALLPFIAEAPGALPWEQVLHMADCALYQAKRAGRNRILGVAPRGASAEAVQRVAGGYDKDLQSAIEAGILEWVG